jgi:hypothetical protein
MHCQDRPFTELTNVEPTEWLLALCAEDEQQRNLAHYLWEKCFVCKLPTDGDNMLMCDVPGCSFEYHTYCLSPPLARIPEGDWKCPDCEAGLPLRAWPAPPM